ncbi:DUF2497 domain-containing protein [Zavarzinia aquatilis]|uniref:DUF2497 domain-containing protein n=1 Tax=Zavarzinia aquatilis TaxID=2211142 RepID=A0A317EEZ8_9PROT|nr:DUF2497 domain-containing protein [Zavarzinia aquatilis]PWR25598.1 hypothetical protein DKG74_01120 [Zavarzinia aquatilis]
MSDELKRDGDAAKGAADPSMEDILASIRRIIAEEGEGREAAPAEPAPAAVLDLTEMVADDGSVVSLPPHEERESLPAEASPVEVRPVDAPPPPVAPMIVPDAAPLDNFVEADTTVPPAAPVAQEDMPMSSAPPPREPLVSTPIANQARNAFAQVADAARPSVSPRESVGDGRTVEQVAEDLMRPMLKAWLDAHLPAIVERAVAEELARITGRGSL